jgi:hypothetical protein
MLTITVFSTVALSAGCAMNPHAPIIVPPEAVREWAYGADGQPSQRYVVRMTDGRREWEVEFPDAIFGSEVRVPLRTGGYQMKLSGDKEGLTGADREIEEAERATRKKAKVDEDPMYGFVDEPLPKAPPRGSAGRTVDERGRPVKKSSYLVGVAQIRQLYDSRNFEVALIQLVDLEKDYPNDEKLLAMKGSIYKKLGKTRLARTTWERVLVLNPDNTVVAGALRQLAEEEDRANDKSQKNDKSERDESGE